jgi:hypothetical protein
MTASLSTTPEELSQSRTHVLPDMAHDVTEIRKCTMGTNGPSTLALMEIILSGKGDNDVRSLRCTWYEAAEYGCPHRHL